MFESEQRLLSTRASKNIVTISKLFDRYELAGFPDWWVKDIHRVKRELVKQLGDMDVTKITRAMVQDYQKRLRETLAPATCDRKLAIAKAAWNHTFSKADNPFSLVSEFREDNQLTRYLSLEEEANLIQVARRSGVAGQIVEMALCTGMRYSEIANLRWDQINWEAEMMEFRQKGNRRAVTAINHCVKRILKLADHSGIYCFPNSHTGKPIGSIEKSWAKMKKKAGINRPFRFHDLRHHVAIKIIRKGGGLTGAQAQLNHSSPKQTMRYAQFIPDYLSDIADLLDL